MSEDLQKTLTSVPSSFGVVPVAISALDFVSNALKTRSCSSLGVEVLTALSILHLVSNPEYVKLHITRSVRYITLEFDVHESDKGKVIGKNGHTIEAIRSLAKSATGSANVEYQIHLIEDRRVSGFR